MIEDGTTFDTEGTPAPTFAEQLKALDEAKTKLRQDAMDEIAALREKRKALAKEIAEKLKAMGSGKTRAPRTKKENGEKPAKAKKEKK